MNGSGRVLALDVGTKTIGLAVSDPSRKMAFPLRTVARRSVVKDTEEIARICVSQGINQLVVGLPLTLDGGEARSAHLARQVATALVALTGLPHAFVDERFSTIEAERRLREAGAPADRRKAVIDQYAAVVILEDWLAAAGPSSAG
ncbi:MAG: Holliday junction resolvase RuvX [Pseudomonadota bacterium]|nr:Holliday junction resolvase RuvX [Pseudomonadota bacterium]